MKDYFLPHVRGVLSLLIYTINTIFWATFLFILTLLKLIIPIKPLRKILDRLLNGVAMNWVGINKLNQRIFSNRTQWDISGIENLKSRNWYMVVANHQSWADILILQNIFYQKIPFLNVRVAFLESLISQLSAR